MACPGGPFTAVRGPFALRGIGSRFATGEDSALAYHAKSRGYPDNTADYQIRKMIEGYRKERVPQPDARTPLTPDILEQLNQLWPHVCVDWHEVRLFRAATLMAFGAFRIRELVATNKSDMSRAALQVTDVLLHPEQLHINVR